MRGHRLHSRYHSRSVQYSLLNDVGLSRDPKSPLPTATPAPHALQRGVARAAHVRVWLFFGSAPTCHPTTHMHIQTPTKRNQRAILMLVAVVGFLDQTLWLHDTDTGVCIIHMQLPSRLRYACASRCQRFRAHAGVLTSRLPCWCSVATLRTRSPSSTWSSHSLPCIRPYGPGSGLLPSRSRRRAPSSRSASSLVRASACAT